MEIVIKNYYKMENPTKFLNQMCDVKEGWLL